MTKTSFISFFLLLIFLMGCGSSVQDGSFNPNIDYWSLSRSEFSIVGMEKKIELNSNGEIIYTEKLPTFEIDRKQSAEMSVSELKNLQSTLLSFDIFNQSDIGDRENDSLSFHQFTYNIVSATMGSNLFIVTFEEIAELPLEIQNLHLLMDELKEKVD